VTPRMGKLDPKSESPRHLTSGEGRRTDEGPKTPFVYQVGGLNASRSCAVPVAPKNSPVQVSPFLPAAVRTGQPPNGETGKSVVARLAV
jgi:hypothetical protein